MEGERLLSFEGEKKEAKKSRLGVREKTAHVVC